MPDKTTRDALKRLSDLFGYDDESDGPREDAAPGDREEGDDGQELGDVASAWKKEGCG